MTSKFSSWKTTSNFLKSVLGSPWVALQMLVSKFNSFHAISLLFRWGWGWLEELEIRLTQLRQANLFELSLAIFNLSVLIIRNFKLILSVKVLGKFIYFLKFYNLHISLPVFDALNSVSNLSTRLTHHILIVQ